MLGLYPDIEPKHARRFLEGGELVRGALGEYRQAVENRSFPTAAESFFLDAAKREHIEATLARHAHDSARAPDRAYAPAHDSAHEGVDAEVAMLQEDEVV